MKWASKPDQAKIYLGLVIIAPMKHPIPSRTRQLSMVAPIKISVCVKEKIDEVLALLDKLPIDEVTLNMDYVRFGEGQIKNTETEFEIASLASYVTKTGLVASVKNVSNAEQADFAKRCKFSKASGRFIREPGSARTINEFFNKN